MKNSLQDFKLMLVYIFEYIVEGKKHSVVLKPIDAANGVILDEVPGQPGLMRGLLVSGGTVHIPIEGITNHFQSWWKLWSDDGRGGVKGSYTDDEERVGNQAARDVGRPGRWDENGCYTHAKEVDRPSEDAKRIYHKDKRPDKYRDDD
jgi:hypothetical protein